MNKSILKQNLIHQPKLNTLHQIMNLSEDEIVSIKMSDIEIDRGEFISNSDLQKKISSWL